MSRALSILTLAALAAALVVLPAPARPEPGPAPAHNPSSFSVCPVIEGGGRTTQLAVASTVEGPAALTLFANGSTVGSIEMALGSNGATVIPIVDVAAVGTVGGLVELPSASAAAGSRILGAVSSTLESCITSIPAQVFLAGGSTAGQSEMTLHLMNPFAGDAVATLVVHSEAGRESNNRFSRVIVPSRGSAVMNLNEVISGREWVTVRVDVTRGRVAAAVRQTRGEAAAAWNAVEPGVSWLIPIPTGVDGRLVVASATPGSVEYQVDLYGAEGVEGAALTGSLSEGEESSLSLADIAGTRAVRVVATSPVVVSLEVSDGTTLSATTATQQTAGSWLLPAAASQGVRVVLLNPELEDASVVVRALREGGGEFPVNLPAEGVIELSLDAADAYLVDSDVPIVAMLFEAGEAADALAMGVPVDNG